MPEQPFFLYFPYKVRFQIYVELGIIIQWRLNLSHPPIIQWSSRDQRIINKDYLANQLFYVSRAVSEDARTMFYSENEFLFDHDTGYGLRGLMSMTPLGWRSLRFICITVGTDCRWLGTARCHGTACEIIEKDSQLSKNTGVLSDWLYICDMLATYIKHDDQLELRLMCDAATKETAAAFLDPLQNLPRLRECSIRLGPYWNPDLQQMIMTTIRQKTRYPRQSPMIFRFLDLPLELQLRILEFSDLVAPTSLIYSSLRNRFVHRKCEGLCCNAFFCGRRQPGDRYYCPSTHTAFSTALPCWETPDMIFLVSQTIRQLAIPIFYSKNILEVQCDPTGSAAGAAWSVQKSAFLCCFPKYSFPHLRHIYWKLPDVNNRRAFQPNKKETEDWIISLYFISLAIPPGKLILELDLSNAREIPWHPEDPEKIALEWALYDRLVEPMVCLRGLLKDLFIHLWYPLHPSLEQMRVGKEQSLEQSIMGSNYDSFARGKKTTEPVLHNY